MHFIQKIRFLVLFLLINSSNHFSYAEYLTISEPKEHYLINLHTLIYNGPAGLKDIQEVIKAPNEQFTKNTTFQETNYGFDQPQGWCKFSIKNTGTEHDWIIKLRQSRIDSVQLYLLRNGMLEKFPLTGHFHKMNERPFASLNFAFPVQMKKNETVTFYLYTQRSFGRHGTSISLERREYHQNYQFIFSCYVGLICGILLLAALIGLVLYFFIAHKLYLYYSIYCLSFYILTLADAGYSHALLTSEKYQVIINTFNTSAFYWIVGWHLLLTISFLNLKNYRYKWFYYLGFFTGLLFCLLAIILLFPVPDVIRGKVVMFSYYIGFFFDIYIPYVLYVGFKRKEPGLIFCIIGFAFTIVVASLLMLAEMQIIDGISQNTDIYYITPLIECLFMVIGLAFHFSHNMREKLKVQLALNNIQSQIITVQEDERKRIAQDLHDQVGNSLAAVKNMLIQKKENSLIDKEVDNILEDIRNISHNLMPVDFQEYHLPDIVHQTINKFAGHFSVRFDFVLVGISLKIAPLKELVIYRIINELMSNIIKHSGASTALIQLIYQEDRLVVMVEDNGKGFDKSNLQFKNGLGLKNIQLRTEYIGAKLTFESDHKGVLIIVELPYDKGKY